MQLKILNNQDIIFEWINYDQFNGMEKISKKNDFFTIYSAIWKDGPLYWNNKNKEYIRNSNEIVALKYLKNNKNEKFLKKALKEYSIRKFSDKVKVYGISQDPNTKDYIIVIENKYCEKCGEIYTNTLHEWCKPCQIDYFIDWTSGNEIIDNFIQKMQLKIEGPLNIVFEWISYNQFKDIVKSNYNKTYSAIWNDGPLHYNLNEETDEETEELYVRESHKNVALKYICKSRNISLEYLKKIVKEYSIKKFENNVLIYGLTQNTITKDYFMVLDDEYFGKYCAKCYKMYTNPLYEWCKPCQLSDLKKNFTNHGDEKIDDLIRKMQLKINDPQDIIFEWIPYDQFNDIKEVRMGNLATAIWKDGPLRYSDDIKEKRYIREPDKHVTLKYLNNVTIKILNKVLKEYSIKRFSLNIYGISQNPITKDYIMVLNNKYFVKHCARCGKLYTNVLYKWCRPCQINCFKNNFINWTSGNEKIDYFIQKIQLKINNLFEWIPYSQFNNIEGIGKYNSNLVCSAIWKNGPLCYNLKNQEYTRNPNERVALKYLGNSQNISDNLNEILKEYSIKKFDLNIYGITKNPITKDYFMVLDEKYFENYCVKCENVYTNIPCGWCRPCQIDYLKNNFKNWTSGNEKINNSIQEMQLKIHDSSDIVFEWIPFEQFDDIERIGKGGFAIVYSAIWKDGPLNYCKDKNDWIRDSNKKIALKCLENSQNITDEFLNEVRAYSINSFDKILKVYGISQHPDTKDYIIVLQYAEGRNFNYWLNNNSKYFNWLIKLRVLSNIINGLKEIHQKQMVHRDFHIGNILFKDVHLFTSNYISDMGLCGEIGNIDEECIYGVMPYIAPEVLRGKPYTQAADIYSFGMIMYFVATERQPFSSCAHDHHLALDICKGIRPEIYEPEAPKCYINLMKRCWDSNPDNRPNAAEIEKLIISFYNSYCPTEIKRGDDEINEQFKEAEKYRRTANNKTNKPTIHVEAVFTSRLLNSFTQELKILSEILEDNILDKSECLDCEIYKQ
ncbi:hypothetical protein RclHR1_00290024 [Rhizophagus clarus]|uniref:Protein kinase domain-containing protein n=1 Tax=Rhizophagus clarus TaxID=94130 RepID=A0A2Z6RY73_9GLOM|nr:hypothetical protein RclHR1_00290024 [Rhizophagus clarus]